jgi:hypothetical protein
MLIRVWYRLSVNPGRIGRVYRRHVRVQSHFFPDSLHKIKIDVGEMEMLTQRGGESNHFPSSYYR